MKKKKEKERGSKIGIAITIFIVIVFTSATVSGGSTQGFLIGSAIGLIAAGAWIKLGF